MKGDLKPLTKEQAIVISAYTGDLAGSFGDLQAAIEERLGRPVWTHEFASAEFAKQIREAFKEDFLVLCGAENK